MAQAEFLVRDSDSNEANVRRSVSSAYYALFHLLVRDAILNWKHADHRSRLAHTFDHKRMKDASTAILKEIGNGWNQETADPDRERFRYGLSPRPLWICSRLDIGPITTLQNRSSHSTRRYMLRKPDWPF